MSLIQIISSFLSSFDFKKDKEEYLQNIQSIGYNQSNDIIFKNLDILIKTDPEKIIFHIRSLLRNPVLLNFLIKMKEISREQKSETTDYSHQLKSIALFWESTLLFSFLSALIANFDFQFRDESLAILKPFRLQGFSKDTIDKIRQIRNSYSHILNISKGNLIDDKGRVVLSLSELDEIYHTVSNFKVWYLKTLYFLLRNHPDFFALFYYCTVSSIIKNKSYFLEIIENLEKIKTQKVDFSPPFGYQSEVPSNFLEHMLNYPKIKMVQNLANSFSQGIKSVVEEFCSKTDEDVMAVKFEFSRVNFEVMKSLSRLGKDIKSENERLQIQIFIRFAGMKIKKTLK